MDYWGAKGYVGPPLKLLGACTPPPPLPTPVVHWPRLPFRFEIVIPRQLNLVTDPDLCPFTLIYFHKFEILNLKAIAGKEKFEQFSV